MSWRRAEGLRPRWWHQHALALTVAGSMGAGVPLVLGFHGSNATKAFAAALADPLSVLGARSPGRRSDGALFQTKTRIAAQRATRPGKVNAPQYRVLSGLRTREPSPGAPIGVGEPNIAPAMAAPGLPGIALPSAPVGFPIFGGGGSVPGGGGPFIPGEPGTNPPPVVNPEPPVTSVPELTTWVYLALGLGLTGGALRRRRSDQPRRSAPSTGLREGH